MKTKTPKTISEFPLDAHPIIRTYFEFTYLKQLYRQGWLHKNIPAERCESVADHSFGLAVIAMLLAETWFPEMDLLKILRMSLIHDFGEIYAGDFVPQDGIKPEQKYQLEKESVAKVFGQIPNGAKYLDLWEEFERGFSPEARFVRQIDKLEMALQASVYEHQGYSDLSDFYQSASATIFDPKLTAIFDELQQGWYNAR